MDLQHRLRIDLGGFAEQQVLVGQVRIAAIGAGMGSGIPPWNTARPRPAARPDARRLLTTAFCREVVNTDGRGECAMHWVLPVDRALTGLELA